MKIKTMEPITTEELLVSLRKLLLGTGSAAGSCGGIFNCQQCPIPKWRRGKGEDPYNCTSTNNVDTAWKMVHELQVSELINII